MKKRRKKAEKSKRKKVPWMANENKVIKKEKKGPKMGKEIEDINVVDFGDGGEYDEQDETCKKNSRGVGDIFNSCEDDVFGIE